MDKPFLLARAVIRCPTRSCQPLRSCTDISPQLSYSWVGWFQFGLYQAWSSLWFILNYKWNKIRPIKSAQDIPTLICNSFSKTFSAGTQSWVKSAQWGKALKPLPDSPVGSVFFVSSLPHPPLRQAGKGLHWTRKCKRHWPPQPGCSGWPAGAPTTQADSSSRCHQLSGWLIPPVTVLSAVILWKCPLLGPHSSPLTVLKLEVL